jgi:chromosome partitioning protein
MTGKVIPVANEKGGVGKTTVSVQLSMELAEKGNKVCLIDNDPSGDATTALFGEDVPQSIAQGNKPEARSNTIKLYTDESEFLPEQFNENLHIFGATDALSVLKSADLEPAYVFLEAIELLIEKFDYVVIDCPPSFGLLFTAAMFASQHGGILIPSVPDELSFKAAKKVIDRVDKTNKRMNTNINVLGVVANKVKRPPPLSVQHYLQEMEREFDSRFFKVAIDETVRISDAIAFQSKVSSAGKQSEKAAQQITEMTNELLSRL